MTSNVTIDTNAYDADSGIVTIREGIIDRMLSTRWTKVIIDLWKNRGRTLIVSLAIAVGVYAVGVVLDAREMLVREYNKDKADARVASAIIHTAPFDEDLARSIARLPGVAAAEGRSLARVRVYDGANSPRDLVLVAIPDFSDMQVDSITRLTGTWPPGRGELVLERLALDYLGAAIGRNLDVEMEGGSIRSLAVAGSAFDEQRFDPDVAGVAFGYVSRETMADLGLPDTFSELHIRVADPAHEEAHILAVVSAVEDHLNRSGRTVLARTIITNSPADPFIDTIVLILTTFGVIILFLSGFLVVNAMTALITQQIPQIGVMKLIGARRGQVIALYLATVLAYGLLAVSVAIPLALLTARLLMAVLVEPLLNVMSESYAVPLPLLAIQAAVGLLLPLLAGLAPVIRGTAITTQRALNDGGLGVGTYRQGLIERLMTHLQRIWSMQHTLLLSMRNTLRHKGRLAQTLVVLVLGTALFIAVWSVRVSVNATLDNFMRFHRYDVSVELERPERLQRLEQTALQVPGAEQAAVEVWSVATATRLRPDGTETDGFALNAVPPDSDFMEPRLTAGRWLASEGQTSSNAIVVNSDFVDEEPDVQVGSDLRLDIGGREATWRVVGIVPTESRGPAAYVADDNYGYVTRTPGQGNLVLVRTAQAGQDDAAQNELAVALLQHFEDSGLRVAGTQTTQVMRSENELLFTIVVAFLILMALLLAAVGGLGLTTTMSINVLERVREIGVLRAIGAANSSVRQIILVEGVAMGIISWLTGALLSLALSPLFSRELGLALIKIPLDYHYSPAAAIAWFFVLQAVAIVASLGPARNAVRLTVREVLAYE